MAETTTAFDRDALHEEFAKVQGISLEDAIRAFDDSGPLYDFVLDHGRDPRFGAVWASYDNGYKVHARSLDSSFDTEIDALQAKTSGAIERHVGGASNSAMMDAVEALRTAKSSQLFQLNHQLGTIDLRGPGTFGIAAVTDAAIVRTVSAGPVLVGETNAGADFAYFNGSSWSVVCTVGFQWRSQFEVGFTLAGHCPDPNDGTGYVNGLYSGGGGATFRERCPPNGDSQLVSYAGVPNVDERAFDKRTYPHPFITFAVAGGYYVGQPTLKAGRFSNGSTGSNLGTASGIASYLYTAGGDCSGTYTMTGLQYSNLSAAGDSGGPVFLSYGNSWFLAATHAAGPAGSAPGPRLGMWVPWIDLGGAQICTVSNPCN